MLRIGLTGGIGSGKSTVAKIFEVLGVPTYYADDAARKLLNENEELKEKVIETFGSSVYINGKLDRVALAGIVFNAPKKLELLNSLVHPVTFTDATRWLEQLEQQSPPVPYAIKEAALIFESGAEEWLDYVVGVSAPVPLRVKRAMERDNSSEADIMARMSRQMDEDEKMELCNFVIINNEKKLLIPQVTALHEHILGLATSTKL
jgi:dephospho-CoA kinase